MITTIKLQIRNIYNKKDLADAKQSRIYLSVSRSTISCGIQAMSYRLIYINSHSTSHEKAR